MDYPPLAYHATALHSFFPVSMTIEIEMRESFMGLKREIKREIVGASFFRKILALPQAVVEARAIATGNVSNLQTPPSLPQRKNGAREQVPVKITIKRMERDSAIQSKVAEILDERRGNILVADRTLIPSCEVAKTPSFIVSRLMQSSVQRLNERDNAWVIKRNRKANS